MGFKLDFIDNKTKESAFDLDKLLKKEIHFSKNRGFSNKKKEIFYNELSILLKSGLTLKDSLLIILEEQSTKKDKERIKHLLDSLIAGNSLSKVMMNRKEFTPYEFYSIQIGEETGSLHKVIELLSKFFRRKNGQKRMVSSALSYPIIVLSTAILAISFMLYFVVPMFEGIFSQNNKELPEITMLIIWLSEFFSNHISLLLFFVLMIIMLSWIYKKKNWYRNLTTSLSLRIPFIGEFQRKIKIAQFTEAMYLLTSSKVSIVRSLDLTYKMIQYLPIERALQNIKEEILTGKSLHESFSRQKIFDSKMSSLIKVAEETNQNDLIFKRLANQYHEEIDYKSKLISTTIEPIIILVLGVIVATILIAMYLPMFKMSNVF